MISFRDVSKRLDPIRPPNRLKGASTAWLDTANAESWLVNSDIVKLVSALPHRSEVGLWHKQDKGLLEMLRWSKDRNPYAGNGQFSFRDIAKRSLTSPEWTFKFLWYNTWLLRTGLPFGSKPMLNKRSAEIGQAIAEGGYSIVGLCEVFDEDERKVICDAIGRTHKYDWARGPEHTFQLSSGLMTFGIDKVGIQFRKGQVFEEEGGGLDSLAEKGMLYTELELRPPGTNERPRIDFFTTHLHAEEEEARLEQVNELVDFIKKYSKPQNPTIVAGDFNIDSRSTSTQINEYHNLLAKMSSLGLFDLWLSRGGLAGGTNVSEDPDSNANYTVTCDFDPSTSGSYCLDYPQSGTQDLDRIPGKRLDYIFVEETRNEHSIVIDMSRVRRVPFWRGYNSSTTLRHDRFFTTTNVSEPGEPVPASDTPNFMSDHLGLEFDLFVTPMTEIG